MSEFKGTPGPWVYENPDNYCREGVKREALLAEVTVAPGPNGITEYVWEVGREGQTVPPGIAIVNYADSLEGRANARLIAAAPDLLEVVRELVETPWSEIQLRLLQEKAMAAIAKATDENR